MITGRASAMSIVSKTENNTLRMLAYSANFAFDAHLYIRIARSISSSAISEMTTGVKPQTQAGLSM